ncbi:MAG: glucosamine-6-phosphate deaminase [Planctomycetaceae bacterium]|nr:glucosamine-6-phosphate deaminase [Planctomycetaceae bacterium]MBP61280.1 glucosamine-6-phosphate deaminase [Planctomycetaceae bacterium]
MDSQLHFAARERVPCFIFPEARDAAQALAQQIATLIRTRASEGRSCVLGLATGSTPVGVYNELVRMHREEGLSFANVVTFNLDEYFPMQPFELQSYARFMREHLFDHVDIPPENVNIPDGSLDRETVPDLCRAYEEKILSVGGIDLQVLGIGRTSHIGFNEPGSSRMSRTRLITLDQFTRVDAASDFFGEENVPRHAVTMGIGTILEARQIVLLAFGEHKAQVIARAVEDEVSPAVAASFLQEHRNAQIYLDHAAGADLTRMRSPWILGTVAWDEKRIRQAIIWLARKLNKPILKLTEQDYNEEGLQDLLAEHGPAYDINLSVFRHLQATINGWPGGKPRHAKQPGDLSRPFDDIFPKQILVFSPHPDDDVISMGGTLTRLVDQGHEVHVAYQTSGNIAVFDDDAERYMQFVAELSHSFELDPKLVGRLENLVEQSLASKRVGEIDAEEVRQIKTLIRRSEARAAASCCGIKGDHLYFLDMPFYETGRVKKSPLSVRDVKIVFDLLRTIRPHQIYAAGDLSDPHGTHRTCLTAVLNACRDCQQEDWFEQCEIWLYRGAWQEWEPHEIDVAVPLSPQEVVRKRNAIFKHESQKDRAMFPGPDVREFWQRAESRNAETARLYDALGLAEYEAIEGFVRGTEVDGESRPTIDSRSQVHV